MKILVAGGDTPWTQAIAAELYALGHEVRVYDYQMQARRLRVLGLTPAGRWRMQRELVRLVRSFGPDLLLANKGQRLWGSTLGRISRLGTKTANWFPDDPHRLDLSMRLCRRYDVFLTHCSYAAKRLREERGANAIYMPLSCTPLFFKSVSFEAGELERYRSDVCFIGGCDAARVRVLTSLARDLEIKVWGPNWQRTDLRQQWQGHGAYGLEAVKALAAAKVVLNVHRNFGGPFERYGHGANIRVFETTAAGAFLVCDRKKDVEAMFEDGSEVAFYETVEECREKIRYYVEHEQERRDAAARAQEKARREHSLRKRLTSLLERVEGPPER